MVVVRMLCDIQKGSMCGSCVGFGLCTDGLNTRQASWLGGAAQDMNHNWPLAPLKILRNHNMDIRRIDMVVGIEV